jgi:hypothetical protein
MRPRLALTLLMLGLSGSPLRAQESNLPPGDDRPLLRLEGGGPAGNVTALAFSPDGKRLFAAGFDKVVRVWALDDRTGTFQLDGTSSYRVPIGPGTRGAINALALSSDGNWLAVGGLGVVRGGVEFHNDFGKLWPSLGFMTDVMRLDEGLIYVFHTGKRDLRLLRGHTGAVESLAFVPPREGKPLLLVSTAGGWDATALKKTGEVRTRGPAGPKISARLGCFSHRREAEGLARRSRLGRQVPAAVGPRRRGPEALQGAGRFIQHSPGAAPGCEESLDHELPRGPQRPLAGVGRERAGAHGGAQPSCGFQQRRRRLLSPQGAGVRRDQGGTTRGPRHPQPYGAKESGSGFSPDG